MVNFRYHIVSLIAVFVALCLGVVLGAGPLQSRISSGLTPTTSTASSNEALAQAQNNSKIEARAVAELAQGRLARCCFHARYAWNCRRSGRWRG